MAEVIILLEKQIDTAEFVDSPKVSFVVLCRFWFN